MNNGFFPALGTPLNGDGALIADSYRRHVEDQVAAGASGVLAMGSMGNQPSIANKEFAGVAQATVEAAKGACQVFAGVMDNSIRRVKDRIDCLQGIKLDGVVATTPYYFTLSQTEIVQFYESIAAVSPFPVFAYDLPDVTQCKIQADTAVRLMSIPNVVGIKTGDLATVRTLYRRRAEVNADFHILFSGLDVFDIAYEYGIRHQLDGMFSCMAPTASSMYRALAGGDRETAAARVDNILLLREVFLEVGVFAGFTCAMNLLGYEGSFSPDYTPPLGRAEAERVEACMKQLRLI